MAEGMDLTPDTTCWSRISAIIAGRLSYINHKKPEHGKPRPPNTNHIYGFKNGIRFSASFTSAAMIFFSRFINLFNPIYKSSGSTERLYGKISTMCRRRGL